MLLSRNFIKNYNFECTNAQYTYLYSLICLIQKHKWCVHDSASKQGRNDHWSGKCIKKTEIHFCESILVMAKQNLLTL